MTPFGQLALAFAMLAPSWCVIQISLAVAYDGLLSLVGLVLCFPDHQASQSDLERTGPHRRRLYLDSTESMSLVRTPLGMLRTRCGRTARGSRGQSMGETRMRFPSGSATTKVRPKTSSRGSSMTLTPLAIHSE